MVLASCPIWHNKAISAARNPLNNRIWKQHNTLQISHFIENGGLLSFDELMSKYDLSTSDFLQYAQLASIFSKLPKNYLKYDNVMDNKFRDLTIKKGTVSVLYKMLICSDDTLNRQTQLQLKQDIGCLIDTSEWKPIWRNITKICKSVRLRMIQFKTLHRAYVTPAKLKKIDTQASDLCWGGCGNRGTLIHMLWQHCPDIKNFWTQIIRLISELLNINFSLSPATCLLGYWDPQFQSKQMYKIANLAFIATKKSS